MSTEQKQPQPKDTKVDPAVMLEWNNKFYGLDPRMARKLRFETDEALKRKPRALPRKVAPYPPLSSWEQQIADVKKLPGDQRAAAYAKILQSLRSTTQFLKDAKNLDAKRIEFEQGVLMTALQKLRAASTEDMKPKDDQPLPQQTVPQQTKPPVKSAEERKKAIAARLEAIKEDLKRAEKAPQDTADLQRDAGLLRTAKQALAGALQAPDYDLAESEIAKVELLSSKLAVAESKKRVGEIEKTFTAMAKNETPQKTRNAKAIDTAIDAAKFSNMQATLDATITQESIDQHEANTDGGTSKLAAVTAAMKNVLAEQAKLNSGKGTIVAYTATVNTLETEAQKYIKDHKNALTKEGKARITAAEDMLTKAKTVLETVKAANDQAVAAAHVLKAATGESLSYDMIAEVDEMQKSSPHLSAATKSICQFEVNAAKKRLDAAEDARLLKISKPLATMNGNDLTGNMILSIEDTLSAAEKNRTVDGAVKTQVQNAIKAARLALTAQMQKELADPSLSDQDKMAIQLRRGGSKPPKGKGESDSFFIYGPDGKPSAIFKPKEGENVKDGLPGGGAAREILTSKFNDLIKNSTGLDFGVAPTQVAHLESDQFTAGTRAQDTKRVGAVQSAIPNEGNILEMAEEDPSKLALIPDEDVQKIAILDFVSLQADRNCGNILIQDQGGQKKLVPIDGGFSFPSPETFKAFSVGMASNGQVGPNRALKGAENAVSQLPQSNKPFTPAMLKVIADMKPDQIVAQMKQATLDLENDAPELKGTVDPKCFDAVGRSIKFLQKAAKHLTPAQLTLVYALDFATILDAKDSDLDSLMDEMVKTAKDKPAFEAEMKNREQTYAQLGGDKALLTAGWPVDTDKALQLDLKRKIEILQNPGANPPPPKPVVQQPPQQQATQQATPPPDDQVYQQLGGDKAIKEMIAAGDRMAKLTDTLVLRIGSLKKYKEYKDLGGDAIFNEMLQSGDTTVAANGDFLDRNNAISTYLDFKAAGGDGELNRLAKKKDPRVAKWSTKSSSDKLRALKDYKLLETNGDEFDRLGGLAKAAELKKKYYAGGSRLPYVLAFLQTHEQFEALGGDDKYLSVIRRWKADSSVLFENLDAKAKKLRIAIEPYKRIKGGVEGINELEKMIEIINATA